MTSDDFRSLMKRAGINQRQLAETLGVAPNTVSRWASGLIPVAQHAIAYLELLAKVREAANLPAA